MKSMSARGKKGHLEKVHGRGLPMKENSPRICIDRIVRKRRPLAKADVRVLMTYIDVLLSLCNETRNLVEKRRRILQCEYLMRELEVKFGCTLEEVVEKFPELQIENSDEIECIMV